MLRRKSDTTKSCPGRLERCSGSAGNLPRTERPRRRHRQVVRCSQFLKLLAPNSRKCTQHHSLCSLWFCSQGSRPGEWAGWSCRWQEIDLSTDRSQLYRCKRHLCTWDQNSFRNITLFDYFVTFPHLHDFWYMKASYTCQSMVDSKSQAIIFSSLLECSSKTIFMSFRDWPIIKNFVLSVSFPKILIY